MVADPTLSELTECGVVAVMRGLEPETLIETGDALRAGGVTTIEVTADSPGAIEGIDALADHFAGTEVHVGAGTVIDEETANDALRAGSEFVVSPSLHEDVIETCNRYGVASFPGIMTPTEAVTAIEAGASAVKVFPAKSVGPAHVGALKGPLGQLDIVPTGGVGPDNAQAYIEAGAIAVGAGGSLIDEAAIERGDFEVITENAEELVAEVEAGRGAE
ncbi:bifunctional 4-hydroxy-2-oxoglutarate aldolase/2-dehydro-3-deoxy-phosphogluconate aldolase [Halarchaeum salinum]|uniref:Bifunctional 4-hydroxy-2-oxoglutarate aldolase/2-dehydro-3-deoxy-phosphogluconate aldolase n=1 Tax=Halarchaeum salinum TaxID=489912 RepID=A0AAV3S5G6_9EURY